MLRADVVALPWLSLFQAAWWIFGLLAFVIAALAMRKRRKQRR